MLRDKTAKGYPIKKVRIRCCNPRALIHSVIGQLLLVLWKTLLTCWGGVREHARVKKLARELAGLPPVSENCEEFTRQTLLPF